MSVSEVKSRKKLHNSEEVGGGKQRSVSVSAAKGRETSSMTRYKRIPDVSNDFKIRVIWRHILLLIDMINGINRDESINEIID